MPDGQFASLFPIAETADGPEPGPSYAPSFTLLLQGLDTTELAMAETRVSVSAAFLRFLLGEFARTMTFDEEFYAAAYPDAEAALLAGGCETLRDHFVQQGYFERRLPYELPFDAAYYGSCYVDLAAAFPSGDRQGLRRHFRRYGWHEGRAGAEAQRGDADRWLAAARADAPDAR